MTKDAIANIAKGPALETVQAVSHATDRGETEQRRILEVNVLYHSLSVLATYRPSSMDGSTSEWRVRTKPLARRTLPRG